MQNVRSKKVLALYLRCVVLTAAAHDFSRSKGESGDLQRNSNKQHTHQQRHEARYQERVHIPLMTRRRAPSFLVCFVWNCVQGMGRRFRFEPLTSAFTVIEINTQVPKVQRGRFQLLILVCDCGRSEARCPMQVGLPLRTDKVKNFTPPGTRHPKIAQSKVPTATLVNDTYSVTTYSVHGRLAVSEWPTRNARCRLVARCVCFTRPRAWTLNDLGCEKKELMIFKGR